MLAQAARFVEQYLKSLSRAAIDVELESVEYLRPLDTQPLPPLAADDTLDDLLRVQTRKYQPIFRNFDHEKAVKEEYDHLNDKRKAADVPDCADFPDDEASQHRLVEELFNAILDSTEAEELPRLVNKKGKKRKASEMDGEHSAAQDDDRQWTENTYVKRVKSASDIEIQFIAWNLLVSARCLTLP